jgi:hypothetical protein
VRTHLQAQFRIPSDPGDLRQHQRTPRHPAAGQRRGEHRHRSPRRAGRGDRPDPGTASAASAHPRRQRDDTHAVLDWLTSNATAGCASRRAGPGPPRSPPRSPGSRPSPRMADPAAAAIPPTGGTQETTATAATDGSSPCPGHASHRHRPIKAARPTELAHCANHRGKWLAARCWRDLFERVRGHSRGFCLPAVLDADPPTHRAGTPPLRDEERLRSGCPLDVISCPRIASMCPGPV